MSSVFSSASSKVTSNIYSQINTTNTIKQSVLSQCKSTQNSPAQINYSKKNNCPDIPYYRQLNDKLVKSKISYYFHNTKQSHFYQFLMRSFSLKGQLAFINPETLSNIYSIDIFRVSKEKILIRATYDHCFGEAFGELINFNEFQQAVIAEINGDIKQEGIIADAPEQVSLIKKQEQLKQFITDKITQLTPQNGSWIELDDQQINNLIELTAAAPSILDAQMLAGCGKFINLPNLDGRKVYFCQTSSSQYQFKIASSAENTSPENNSRNFTFQELEAHLRKKEAMEKNVKIIYSETSSYDYSNVEQGSFKRQKTKANNQPLAHSSKMAANKKQPKLVKQSSNKNVKSGIFTTDSSNEEQCKEITEIFKLKTPSITIQENCAVEKFRKALNKKIKIQAILSNFSNYRLRVLLPIIYVEENHPLHPIIAYNTKDIGYGDDKKDDNVLMIEGYANFLAALNKIFEVNSQKNKNDEDKVKAICNAIQDLANLLIGKNYDSDNKLQYGFSVPLTYFYQFEKELFLNGKLSFKELGNDAKINISMDNDTITFYGLNNEPPRKKRSILFTFSKKLVDAHARQDIYQIFKLTSDFQYLHMLPNANGRISQIIRDCFSMNLNRLPFSAPTCMSHYMFLNRKIDKEYKKSIDNFEKSSEKKLKAVSKGILTLDHIRCTTQKSR